MYCITSLAKIAMLRFQFKLNIKIKKNKQLLPTCLRLKSSSSSLRFCSSCCLLFSSLLLRCSSSSRFALSSASRLSCWS